MRSPTSPIIDIIGGGLAGSEAALQLSKRGFQVNLYDMKPEKTSAAHHSKTLAEIVCSNSFGSQGGGTASGLVKQEMAALGCELLNIAQSVSVPAGKALAVDRERFTEAVTERVNADPNITLICQDVAELPLHDGKPADFTIIATGPLTSSGLVATIGQLLKRDQLYFFDAAAPIIAKDSIDMDIAFVQDRYGLDKSTNATTPSSVDGSYINCPLDKPQYEALIAAIMASEKTELKDFESNSKSNFFESCLPIEVLASRGIETLRYGPWKPVGLEDPRTGRWPYAVVQLRQDNAEGTLYNMVGCQTNIKWGAQKAIIQMIPGLENAEIVRYGVMHRNTYIHSPEVLTPTLQLKQHPQILFAGQLTGTEGYTESVATGLIAALNVAQMAQGKAPIPFPKETMLGALLHYITRAEAIGKDFQPINSNWGILSPLPDNTEGLDPKEAKRLRKDKTARNARYVSRALTALAQLIQQEGLLDGIGDCHVASLLAMTK